MRIPHKAPIEIKKLFTRIKMCRKFYQAYNIVQLIRNYAKRNGHSYLTDELYEEIHLKLNPPTDAE